MASSDSKSGNAARICVWRFTAACAKVAIGVSGIRSPAQLCPFPQISLKATNIAEGYERGSRKEYLQFLRIAKGSCGELRTQIVIGKQAGLLEEALAEDWMREAGELSRMPGSIISKLNRSPQ